MTFLASTPTRPLCPTTPELARDLHKIDYLIAALQMDMDAEDLEDVAWLQARRRDIAAALVWRRARKRRKVVSLAAWRKDSFATPGALPRQDDCWIYPPRVEAREAAPHPAA